jgi:peroxiredoxin family protein
VHIPLGQLRDRLASWTPKRPIIPFCAIGVRAYNAARILMQNGFADVLVYPAARGSISPPTIRNLPEAEKLWKPRPLPAPQAGSAPPPCRLHALDCSGLQCPGPIMKVFETMKTMPDGRRAGGLRLRPGLCAGHRRLVPPHGQHARLDRKARDGDYVGPGAQKGGGRRRRRPVVRDTPQGKTIIVFSGDLDKVLASFIIANGAAAMGRPVTMFFTFWGLTVLRKAEKQPVKKTFMEAMFGAMLPRGDGKLKLSRMNMGGMGTAMMKKIMGDKNVDSLETLIQKAIRQGVKIVACTMSMDVMGIKEEELIDGVELGGVGAYLGDAEESNVNLFI